MNLGAKLDRLRGTASSTIDRMSGLPRRAAAHRPARGCGERRAEHLAEQLQARPVAGGLFLSERTCALRPPTPGPVDLTLLPEVCTLSAPDWVYLDTETTGLSGGVGNLAFMVGVARRGPDHTLLVRQYVLAGFAAEAAMLRELVDWIGPEALLVSFNGKCFDMPLLASRLALHRLPDRLSGLAHLDLMYPLRRAYRRRWPDCRLQTAERLRIGLERIDDLPGAEAPAAWRHWLHQGDSGPLARVLEHNRQDVVSLAELHACLVADYGGHGRRGPDHDAIARSWARCGQTARALRVWEQAHDLLDERGLLELADTYRRTNRWQQAEAVWLQLFRRGSRAAALALSKYHEHRRRDPGRAIRFAGHCEGEGRAARLARLQAKCGPNLCLPLEG
jgi:uncharacterized protein YprB with RNaseH-like and TPR domain